MFKGLLLAGALVALSPIAAQAEPTPQEMRMMLVDITRKECQVHAVGWLKDIKSQAGPIMYDNLLAEQAMTCLGSAIEVIDALVDFLFENRHRAANAREDACFKNVQPSRQPGVVYAGRLFHCLKGWQ